MNDAEFKQYLSQQGYGDANSVTYDADFHNDMHSHEFSACLRVKAGAFTLVTGSDAVTYQPGEICELAAGTPHAERAGPDGVTFLVGKK